jgi:exopolysaccharide biosynthesis polyprenyl glycosylphosphotransferase
MVAGRDHAVLPSALLATAIWFVMLMTAMQTASTSPLALALPVASVAGTIGGAAVVSIVAFATPSLTLTAFDVLAMAAGVLVASVAFEAVGAKKLARRRRVLIVGRSKGGEELVRELAGRADLGLECLGIVDDDTDGAAESGALGRGDQLTEIFLRERPDVVVLAGDSPAEACQRLLDASSLEFRVVTVHGFYEHVFGRVPVHNLSPAWFMSVLHLYQRPYSRITKRAFDLTLAGLGLLLTAPLLMLIALLVRASGPGPILYRQLRLGQGGKTFEILKFRTMVDGAERDGEALWAVAEDARVTRIGRFLRRIRFDELPQLWNVLLGEMSVVGPRPERPEFVDVLVKEVPFWTRRHLVKPGITGWAQLRRGYTWDAGGTAEKLSYDLYYLKHRSLGLDVAITVRTAAIMFSGSGAV